MKMKLKASTSPIPSTSSTTSTFSTSSTSGKEVRKENSLLEENVMQNSPGTAGSLKVSFGRSKSGLTLASLGKEVEKELEMETEEISLEKDYGYDFNVFKTKSKSNLVNLLDWNGQLLKSSSFEKTENEYPNNSNSHHIENNKSSSNSNSNDNNFNSCQKKNRFSDNHQYDNNQLSERKKITNYRKNSNPSLNSLSVLSSSSSRRSFSSWFSSSSSSHSSSYSSPSSSSFAIPPHLNHSSRYRSTYVSSNQDTCNEGLVLEEPMDLEETKMTNYASYSNDIVDESKNLEPENEKSLLRKVEAPGILKSKDFSLMKTKTTESITAKITTTTAAAAAAAPVATTTTRMTRTNSTAKDAPISLSSFSSFSSLSSQQPIAKARLSKRKRMLLYMKKLASKVFILGKENVEEITEFFYMIVAMHYIHLFWFIILYFGYLYYSNINTYPLLIFLSLYLPWYLIPWQKMGGFRSSFLMYRPVWRYLTRHVELQFEREVDLDPNKQYVLGWHPHGILLFSRLCLFGGVWEQMFPGLDCRMLAASPLFWLPPMRDIVILLGCIDASRKYAERALSKGQSLCVYPGGSKEIFNTDRDTKETKLVLRHRKGFIKLAMKYGASLVPVYTFNEKKGYSTLKPRTSFYKVLLKTIRVPLLIFWGRWGTMLPHRDMKLAVVVGEPMEVPKNISPTNDEVEELLGEYISRLNALVARHKDKYSPEETLVIE